MAETQTTQTTKGPRLSPNVVVRHESPNQSERSSVALNLIVLHDTEGANIPHSTSDLSGLGDFFARTATQASSHVATDSDGNSARFVSDRRKAWHCAAYNSASLGIEQIGFASQSRREWQSAQLRETARWIAFWAHRYNIPIRRATVAGGTVTRSGVIRHMDLGVLGGGHSDPGANFPFGRVLTLARTFAAGHFLRGPA